MTTKPSIQIRNLSVRYGVFTAVDNVSIDFREGEFFALLGPSGCGKSTLLRTIAGFEAPFSGKMLLDDVDLIDVPARERPINMMFQSYALFPHMSVEENVRYGLEVSGVAKREITSRVDDILSATHLTSFAKRRPNQLSGGQRQRVALARALVMRPRVLLLDEPLGALDKKLRGAMQLELKRLQHEMGITFIVVTHDQEEALVMADRIALMRAGKIEQIGTAAELYEWPANKFVADFIGTTNFLPASANGGQLEVPFLGKIGSRNDVNGSVTYSLRPERIHVSMERSPLHENGFAGVVEEVAYHGQDVNLHVRLARDLDLVVAKVPASSNLTDKISINTSVWLGWNDADARVLSA